MTGCYPPDKQPDAVNKVIAQAELYADQWGIEHLWIDGPVKIPFQQPFDILDGDQGYTQQGSQRRAVGDAATDDRVQCAKSKLLDWKIAHGPSQRSAPEPGRPGPGSCSGGALGNR